MPAFLSILSFSTCIPRSLVFRFRTHFHLPSRPPIPALGRGGQHIVVAALFFSDFRHGRSRARGLPFTNLSNTDLRVAGKPGPNSAQWNGRRESVLVWQADMPGHPDLHGGIAMLTGRSETGKGAMPGKQRRLGTVNAPATRTYLTQKPVGLRAQKLPVAPKPADSAEVRGRGHPGRVAKSTPQASWTVERA
jgi:hypothetical protein